jgi:hypothetical protein
MGENLIVTERLLSIDSLSLHCPRRAPSPSLGGGEVTLSGGCEEFT